MFAPSRIIDQALPVLQGNLLQSMLVASLPLVTLHLVPVVLSMPVEKGAAVESDEGAAAAMRIIIVLYILITSVTLVFGNAMYFSALAMGKDTTVQAVAVAFRRMYDAVVAACLFTALVALGCGVLLVPGLVVATGLGMTYFVMADHPKLPPWQAIQQSWALVYNQGALGPAVALEAVWVLLYFGGGLVLRLILGALLGEWGALMGAFLQRSLWLVLLLTCGWAARAALYRELLLRPGAPLPPHHRKGSCD